MIEKSQPTTSTMHSKSIAPATPPLKPVTRPSMHTPTTKSTKKLKHDRLDNRINIEGKEDLSGGGFDVPIQFATLAQKHAVLREAQRQARVVGFDDHVSPAIAAQSSPHLSAAAMADMEERMLSEAINASLGVCAEGL
jgi:hypothetical protein